MTQLSSAAGSPLPDQTQLTDVAALLTTAWKRRTLYSTWYGKETATPGGVPAWLCARHALNKWRATLDERGAWNGSLSRHSQPSIIDPDNLVSTAYLKTPGQGVAWSIWEQRQQALAARQQSYATTLSGANRTASALDGLAGTEIGADVLTELNAARSAGLDVSRRLAQLNLSPDALDELLHVRSLLSLAPPAKVLEQEWAAVCSIITAVWKQRQWADWQLEERTQGVTLSQDFFQLLPVDLSQFPPPPPPALDPWRGSPDTLLDWQTTLQSRIERGDERREFSRWPSPIGRLRETAAPGVARRPRRGGDRRPEMALGATPRTLGGSALHLDRVRRLRHGHPRRPGD